MNVICEVVKGFDVFVNVLFYYFVVNVVVVVKVVGVYYFDLIEDVCVIYVICELVDGFDCVFML